MINAHFASGNGSNAVNISNYFQSHKQVLIQAIYCNNPNAGIIAKSGELGIPCHLFNKAQWLDGTVTKMLIKTKIDFVVLAGLLVRYLWI